MSRRRPIHSNTDGSNQFSRGSAERHLYETANTTIGMDARENYRDSSQRRIAARKCNMTSSVNSDAELEEAVSSNRNSRQISSTQQIMGSTSTIGERRKYQRYESKWFNMWSFFDYVYFCLVEVFFLDTWLLSRLSGVRRGMGQRRSMVLWIALLPLVLFAGCWCLLHSSVLFLPGEVIAPHLRDPPVMSVKGGRESSNYETYEKRDDLKFIIDQLSSRISSLEDQVVQHSNKILQLEEGLMGQKLSDMYTQEMDVIKSQLEKLKEMYSELKIHANYVSNEDSGKRIEIILIDYILDTLVLKKGDVEVQEKLSMLKDTAVATDIRVRELIKETLQMYDADKTGRVDYALESAGGQVISTRCTQGYGVKARSLKLLAFTFYHEDNNPRTVIQGNPIKPGVCWAFQGFPGYLLIKLRSSIYVTGFTVEHAPKSILPNGEMESAPKMFNVWGLVDENDPEPVMFGDYEFAASADNLQYFPVQSTTINTSHEYVELRVHSNHGQLEYTCLYRFRVHGKSV